MTAKKLEAWLIQPLQGFAKCHVLMSGSLILLPHSFKTDSPKISGSNMQIHSMKRLQFRPVKLAAFRRFIYSSICLLFYMIKRTWSYLQPDQSPSHAISASLTAYSTISFANISFRSISPHT